jgi:hypothetical protein
LKDLEISNSMANKSSSNLVKRNTSYQSQLRLKIAARKSYSLARQLKGHESKELLTDYSKDRIHPHADNLLEPCAEPKLTGRQLLPLPKAAVLPADGHQGSPGRASVPGGKGGSAHGRPSRLSTPDASSLHRKSYLHSLQPTDR